MELTVAMSLFFAVSVAYILIADIFTILFRMSGLTEEKARFQVISLLTNSGYTTKESELVVDKLIRRRLARTIMLFGYVFSITIITVFVNVVMQLPKAVQADLWTLAIILAVCFVGFMIVKRFPKVRNRFNRLIENWGQKLMFSGNVNIISVVEEISNGGIIAKVAISIVPESLKGKTFGETDLSKKYKIRIIAIERGDKIIDYITDDDQIKENDGLVVYGELGKIVELFSVNRKGNQVNDKRVNAKIENTKKNEEKKEDAEKQNAE